MENPVLIIEGEDYTIKDLIALAEKESRKVVIVGSHSELTQHTETIKKFSRGSIGVIALCISQLTVADRLKVEKPKEDPLRSDGSLIESILAQSRKIEIPLLPDPVEIKDYNPIREVKHKQAKPVKQFHAPQKNHHFRRK